ncbi:hypothetical protein DFP72DRAFT_893113 [Ephemerocybe angulata]|uniref:Gfo/Idh/MocA-like oxidoreductase N-terminal domain-containing protein n=1 Tax=Ephemerocybe angulata TaxID=980116 RepID=A0A8H6I218_9AGAR|nr:hypothetical protein DFP72DRAFT_893113 [Tulosesus angulatus]
MSNSKPIKLGIVGLSARGGWAASAHVPALSHPSLQSTFTLSALQASSASSASAAKEKYASSWPSSDGLEVNTYHGVDASELCNDPNVDVVAVTIKAPDHKAVVDKAIAAGKHIFIEYPPGRTLAESEQMRADVMKNGNIQAMVGLQGVHSAALRKVKKILDSGKIGKVISTTVVANIAREFRFYGPEAVDQNIYAQDRANGATMLSIVIAHQLSSLIHLLGPFTSISAIASKQYPTTKIYSSKEPKKLVRTIASNSPDHFVFAGALKSGAQASITWRSGYKSVPGRKNLLWIIDGEEGCVKFEVDDGPSQTGATPFGATPFINLADPTITVNGQPLDEYLTTEGIEWEEDAALVVEKHEKGTFVEFVRREWVEFGKSLRGGQGEFATLDDAIEVQKVVDAVERSAQLGGL